MRLRFVQVPFITVLLLAALSTSSCDRQGCCVDDFTLYRFSGTIIDSLTDSPIDSVLVTLDDTTAAGAGYLSDTSGFYAGEAIGGNYLVFARKEGYTTKYKQIFLNSNLANVDFELVPDTTK